jgi:hypothetical protein
LHEQLRLARSQHDGNFFVAQSQAKAESTSPIDPIKMEEEVAYLAKRHRVTPAIVREIIKRSGSSERAAIEREIQKGKARR